MATKQILDSSGNIAKIPPPKTKEPVKQYRVFVEYSGNMFEDMLKGGETVDIDKWAKKIANDVAGATD